MQFSYEVVRLWERPAEELLAAEVGVTPLAVLGRLPADLSLEDGLSVVVRRLAERVIREAPPDRAKKLLTEALLLSGLRVRRDAAGRIFRGVPMMEESDTFLMILEQGQEKQAKKSVLLLGEKKLGAPGAAIRTRLDAITDLDRLERMLVETETATRWEQLLDTP